MGVEQAVDMCQDLIDTIVAEAREKCQARYVNPEAGQAEVEEDVYAEEAEVQEEEETTKRMHSKTNKKVKRNLFAKRPDTVDEFFGRSVRLSFEPSVTVP